MKKQRIDKLLLEQGFAESRTKAQALVMAGVVLVDERRVEKPSESFAPTSSIRLKGQTDETKYVGRGGLKLEKALNHFNICVNAYICLDVGSSTGGFTDCLLQNGAGTVYAIDAGTNQLAWKLRVDERVIVRENTNARNLEPSDFERQIDLIVIDVSFISISKLLPALVKLLPAGGQVIALIKPQFEVGKGEVGKGGIVREPEKHESVVRNINNFARQCGLSLRGVVESPILGAQGNKEFLGYYVLEDTEKPKE